MRGLDLSNMTIVEGEQGVLVIDPLISCETAAAALALYREHRGERPLTGLLYTHSHVDHFGGARGVLPPGENPSIPIIAPEGFLEHAVAENVYAGTAMTRRATYMYGALLEKGPAGSVGAGLGQTTSLGTRQPRAAHGRDHAHRAGARRRRHPHGVPDDARHRGARGDELPLPRSRARSAWPRTRRTTSTTCSPCAARSCATHASGPPISTRRSSCSASAPTSSSPSTTGRAGGRSGSSSFLAKQRDLYAYVHDQTLRLLNKGLVASEIAETLELPPGLAREWHCRGYYGSLNHNAKAVYQRYLGWFDGNPAHLWPHPPQAAAERYVALAGGRRARCSPTRGSAFEEGDLRWVVEVVNHLVFAEPENGEAKELQARALEQLGFGAENATWRNFFLMGAKELRDGVAGTATAVPPDMLKGLATQADPRRRRDPSRRHAGGRGGPRDAPEPARHRRAVQAHALQRRADAPPGAAVRARSTSP